MITGKITSFKNVLYSICFRTKDSKFVYCCLERAVTELLEKAEDLGNIIKLIVLKVFFYIYFLFFLLSISRLTDLQVSTGTVDLCKHSVI